MVTFFTIPKPFDGHAGVSQRNALASWSRLKPRCNIILCGDERGTREAAAQFGAQYIGDIARNEFGTPLLDSAFERVERIAGGPLLCYVNADIVLMNNFLLAVQSITLQRFLMVGQRWDVDLSAPWNFVADDWELQLENYVMTYGALHPPTGIDYFVFPRGVTGKLPSFAVGRPGWDNWFIYHMRCLGIPVVDATRVTTVVHQNHNYSHVKESTDNTFEGPEADLNRRLIGGWQHFFTIRNATHFLDSPPSVGSRRTLRLRRHAVSFPVPVVKAWKKLDSLIQLAYRVVRRTAGVHPG